MYSPNAPAAYLYGHLAGLSSAYPQLPLSAGLPPGSKPPLQMMSPVAMAAAASGKLPPKTATVPPLHQVSPSNGLSTSAAGGSLSGSHTSSFAAALRKLAHQAKDPAEEAILKHGGSPPSSHSPRAATPKRPPLMFPAHSSSPASLTSPPVVTIAPTQAHHHASLASSDSRQNMERVPTAHSSSSYEHSGKHEREQRPLSSLSREEERAAGKDNPLSRTPSRAHPQASTTPNGVGLSSQALDMYTRSLQAFRAEEEAARHGLPLPYTLDPAAYAAAAAAAAAYHPALLQQQAAFAAQSPFRFDDPLLLERYRMLQSPYLPFPAGGLLSPHAGALGMHPMLAAAAAAQQRYPADLALLQQQYQYLGAGHPLLDPRFAAQAALLERSRLEEEKARDLIEKEREREREREREKSLDREIEREAALRSERERKHSLERSVRESQEREHRRSMERAARESSEQERRLSLERSAKELLERRDILTVPSRLPASHGAERGPESHHKSHGDGHGARHSTIGRPSSSQAKVEPHNLSSKLSPSGYPLSSREAADQHAGLASHSHSYSKSHESAATAAYNAALVKPHTLEKGHDYLPAHAHRDSRSGHKDPRESPRSSSVGSNIPPGFPLSYYHQPSHLIPGASSAVSPSDAQHPPRSLHPSHLSPSSSSSTHHSDKVRRSSDSSGIFRPFDDDSKPSDSSHHPSSQRNVSQNHHHHHQPHHHHSSSSSSTPSQSQQHHRHHHGHRPTSPSKSSEILTIPSVKVHPQERGSNPPSKVLYNSHERLPSSSLSAHPSSQASPQYGKTSNISNCINDRIERFDFKSLARECMSSTASGLPSEKAGAATGAEVCEIATSVPAAKAMDVQPKRCLSKLDRQELRVRERRKRGEDTESDTEMDEDERIAARLTMIGRATPIPLDTPTEKMEIFEYLGITTLKRKEELQRKKEVRRRHQLRMSSVSPVRRHDDDSCTAGWHSPWLQEGLLPEMGPIHPDELSSEPDVHDKSRFLSGLGLQVLTHTQRDELQRKRFFRVALSKLRRNGLMPSRSLDSLNLETGSCGVKRKFDEMNPNHPAPTSMKEQKTALRISAPCHPTLKGDSSVAHTSHPHLLTFTNNHDHNNHHHHHHHHHQQQHNHQNRQHRHPVPSVLEPAPRRDNRKPSAAATTTTSSSSSTIKQAVIFPEPKSSARSGPQPSASREFAERFHKSVLEQSGLDHSRVPRQEVPAVTSSISSVPVPSSSASSQSQSQSRPLQESAAAPPPSATSSRSASGMTAVYPGFHMPPGIPPSLYASLAWPRHGLGPGAGAAGLEHFSRPREGAADLSQQQQQAELQLLMSRCQQQQQQQASSDQMDRLSESYGRHMAAFLEERQRMEEERKQHQGAMDNLKRNFYNFS